MVILGYHTCKSKASLTTRNLFFKNNRSIAKSGASGPIPSFRGCHRTSPTTKESQDCPPLLVTGWCSASRPDAHSHPPAFLPTICVKECQLVAPKQEALWPPGPLVPFGRDLHKGLRGSFVQIKEKVLWMSWVGFLVFWFFVFLKKTGSSCFLERLFIFKEPTYRASQP